MQIIVIIIGLCAVALLLFYIVLLLKGENKR